MLKLRGSAAGDGGDDTAGSRDGQSERQSRQTCLRRLRGWAVVLAIVVSAASATPLVFGFHVLKLLLLPVATALFVACWLLNRWTVGWRVLRSPLPPLPGLRVVIGLLGAGVVAYAATLWTFDADIEAVRSAKEPDRWAAEMQRLQDDKRMQQMVLDDPLPEVEKDLYLQLWTVELQYANDALPIAKRDVISEEDGSGGSRSKGQGPIYDAKVIYRDGLQQQVDNLPGQIDKKKKEVAKDIEDRRRDKVIQIDAELRQLGPTTPTQPSRHKVLIDIAERKTLPVVVLGAAVLVAFVLVDVLALFLVVRTVCRDRHFEVEVLSAGIRKQALRNAEAAKIKKDAKRPDELSEEMRVKYLNPEADESVHPQPDTSPPRKDDE